MEHFAGYGFNKSHSTAYAFLAYQTAYLKANYPWHFAAALLTIESQNTDKLALYLGECRERGIPVLPPDINESQLRFTVDPGKGVRFGLTAIKNVGEGAIESLLEVRKKHGRISSLPALCEDLDLRLVNKRVFESLTKGRRLRFDRARTGRPTRRCRPRVLRPRLLAAIDAACEHGARVQRDKNEGQAQLFGAFGYDDAPVSGRAARSTASAARGAAVDRNRAAELREGNARPVSGAVTRSIATRSALKEFGARTTGELAEAPVSGPARATPGARADRSRSSPTPASAGSSPRAVSSRRARAIAWRSSRSRIRRAASR